MEPSLWHLNEHFSLSNISSFNYYTTYYLNMRKFLSRIFGSWLDPSLHLVYLVTYLCCNHYKYSQKSSVCRYNLLNEHFLIWKSVMFTTSYCHDSGLEKSFDNESIFKVRLGHTQLCDYFRHDYRNNKKNEIISAFLHRLELALSEKYVSKLIHLIVFYAPFSLFYLCFC